MLSVLGLVRSLVGSIAAFQVAPDCFGVFLRLVLVLAAPRFHFAVILVALDALSWQKVLRHAELFVVLDELLQHYRHHPLHAQPVLLDVFVVALVAERAEGNQRQLVDLLMLD